jgi:Phosphotransferase enzyme family
MKDTAAAALLPGLLTQAGLPADPARELIRQVFPFSGVWRLTYPQRGGETVIYKEAWPPLDNEDTALRYAESCGLPVPHLIASHKDGHRAAILMTDLGQPARTVTDAEGARLAAAIHHNPGSPELPLIDAAALAAMPGRIAERASRHRLPVATIDTAAAIAASADRLAAAASTPPFGLCHSEWHPTSVIIDAAGNPHVYDWARAFTGPGLIDLASWLGTTTAPDLPAVRAHITAYTDAGGHRTALQPRAGIPAEAWACGWHRLWAADWYLQQLDMGWIPDQYLDNQAGAISRHVTEAATLLLP